MLRRVADLGPPMVRFEGRLFVVERVAFEDLADWMRQHGLVRIGTARIAGEPVTLYDRREGADVVSSVQGSELDVA